MLQKVASFAFLKRRKSGRQLSMFFFCIVADAICLLTTIPHTAYVFFLHYSALLLLNFFGRPSDFYHANTHRLTFLGLLHIISVFRHFSFCHWSLSRVSASCISLCYHDFFHIRLCYLFCWVSIRSFFQDNQMVFLSFRNQYMLSVFSGISITICYLHFVIQTYRRNSAN